MLSQFQLVDGNGKPTGQRVIINLRSINDICSLGKYVNGPLGQQTFQETPNTCAIYLKNNRQYTVAADMDVLSEKLMTLTEQK